MPHDVAIAIAAQKPLPFLRRPRKLLRLPLLGIHSSSSSSAASITLLRHCHRRWQHRLHRRGHHHRRAVVVRMSSSSLMSVASLAMVRLIAAVKYSRQQHRIHVKCHRRHRPASFVAVMVVPSPSPSSPVARLRPLSPSSPSRGNGPSLLAISIAWQRPLTLGHLVQGLRAQIDTISVIVATAVAGHARLFYFISFKQHRTQRLQRCGMPPPQWRSIRGKRALWHEEEVCKLATAWYENLPVAAKSLLQRAEWSGGDIIHIKDAQWIVKEEDLINNAHPFIMEAVARYRDRVPSGFFFADVFLAMHAMAKNRLLVPKADNETVNSIALAEGGKLKKLIQKLRGLWRDAPGQSRNPVIMELKALLVKTPAANHAHAAGAGGDDQADPAGAGEDDQADAAGAGGDDRADPAGAGGDDRADPARAGGDGRAPPGQPGDGMSSDVEERALLILEKIFGPCRLWSQELLGDIPTLLGDLPAEVVSLMPLA